MLKLNWTPTNNCWFKTKWWFNGEWSPSRNAAPLVRNLFEILFIGSTKSHSFWTISCLIQGYMDRVRLKKSYFSDLFKLIKSSFCVLVYRNLKLRIESLNCQKLWTVHRPRDIPISSEPIILFGAVFWIFWSSSLWISISSASEYFVWALFWFVFRILASERNRLMYLSLNFKLCI